MVNSVAVSSGDFSGPRVDWVFPPVDYIGEETMASDRQKNILTNLIMERIYSEEQREKWFSQLTNMTSTDCEEAIFEILTSWTVIK